ncbi:MAG: hypothetical protein LBR13_01395 [Dysgonamonadaceae bacterium]|jgi:hypothetical protein|nr:hypothetical protein [Dysgonamonadaceae bacterium]
MNIGYNTQRQQTCNPLGLHRSVEMDNVSFSLHPIRDASLQDTEERRAILVSTERCIPMGCREAKLGTIYDNHINLTF